MLAFLFVNLSLYQNIHQKHAYSNNLTEGNGQVLIEKHKIPGSLTIVTKIPGTLTIVTKIPGYLTTVTKIPGSLTIVTKIPGSLTFVTEISKVEEQGRHHLRTHVKTLS